ncbi:THUMP domain-containing class I SAM-dependent RNA methyltransferase [Rhodobaculum claviforme]|uniref:RNA methyltransferase n=1 Tax=Rhodobaculum claviforme TaxID=1549854 RepID=A0A934TLB7_9RHOB|nr:class I SAM-dependent RNA methyltransferase [Rhodobaculum claviforme]MBK5928250.1 RNA methyltransferase [Rhodobaculum claviforme]
MAPEYEIFLAAPPGLEPQLLAEAAAAGFAAPAVVPGGVVTRGPWAEVWRANLVLRGASRVLVRIGAFRALHVAQLDKRARRFDWAAFLRPDVPVRVEATCRASRIWHAGAVVQRVAGALTDGLGVTIAADAPVTLKVRIEDDLCTLSLDTSGAPLHRRGTKQAVGKAPMRETLAALFLRACGHVPGEPVVDPMCGSGTFVLEAAEMAAGLAPGRGRSFAFEHLAGFDAAAWAAMRTAAPGPGAPMAALWGSDRDQGAIAGATANADRAGVADRVRFLRASVSDLTPPDGPPGLVIVNPPYGARIGERRPLHAVHGALGAVLRDRFSGWRVGLVTAAPELARATALPFAPPGPPIPHGGLKIQLFQTAALP